LQFRFVPSQPRTLFLIWLAYNISSSHIESSNSTNVGKQGQDGGATNALGYLTLL